MKTSDALRRISLSEFIRSYMPCFDNDGEPLLHAVIDAGRRDLCEFLIRIRRVDINALNKLGLSPLFCAVRSGHDDICELLRDNGACFRFASDASQKTFGDRAPFFRRLTVCIEHIRHLIPDAALIQFYHRDHIDKGDFYVACSIESISETIPLEMSTALAYLVVDGRFIDNAAVYDPADMTQSDLVFVPYAIKYGIKAISIVPIYHMGDLVGAFVAWLRTNRKLPSSDTLSNILFDRIESINDIQSIMHGSFEAEVLRAINDVASTLDSVQFMSPAVFLNRVVRKCPCSTHPLIRRARSVLRFLWMMHVPISHASYLYDSLSWTCEITEEPEKFIHQIIDQIMIDVDNNCIDKSCAPASRLTASDIFDIVGRKMMHAQRTADALNNMMPMRPSYENLMRVASIILGKGAVIRSSGSVGLSDPVYRIFAPPSEINPILSRVFNNPPEGIGWVFAIHKVILGCAHPFVDGNGRVMRVFSTMSARSLGYSLIIPSNKKIISSLSDLIP